MVDNKPFLIECLHAKAFSGSGVEENILKGDGPEIHALRKVLENDGVGVFVESPLSGGVRMSKKGVPIDGLGDGCVLGKLFFRCRL